MKQSNYYRDDDYRRNIRNPLVSRPILEHDQAADRNWVLNYHTFVFLHISL